MGKVKYVSTSVCRETGLDRLCTFKVSRQEKTRRQKGGDVIIEPLSQVSHRELRRDEKDGVHRCLGVSRTCATHAA